MPLIVGTWVLAIGIIAAIAAYTSRETFRVHMNDLGVKGTQPVPARGVRQAARRSQRLIDVVDRVPGLGILDPGRTRRFRISVRGEP